MVKKGLGEILLTAGLVTKEQLATCQAQVLATGISLEACLIEQGYVQQDALSKVLADFFRYHS